MALDASGPARILSRSVNYGSSARWIRSADIRHLVLMWVYRLTTALLPPARWRLVTDLVPRLRRRPRRRRIRQMREIFSAVYGHDITPDTVRAVLRDRDVRIERRRLYIVAERRPGRWRPTISLGGIGAVDAALARGKGVILWFDDFIDHNLVAKKGLHEAGYALHYLSSARHGSSMTAFGRRYLNPIQIAAESRYLRERLVLSDGETGRGNEISCTRRMVAILAENGIVGIANNLMTGSRVVEVPFGPGARLTMPTAPVNLALQRGAALFPVATIENEPLAHYSVIIGPQLVPDASKAKDAALAETAMEHAEGLVKLAKAYPDQWLGWRRHSLSVSPVSA